MSRAVGSPVAAKKQKIWRPSIQEMKKLARLYGACRDARDRSVRPLPRIVDPVDMQLFVHLVELFAANFDGPYGKIGADAARYFDSALSDASELDRLAATFRQRGGDKATLIWLADLAKRFCEGVILAFDALYETKGSADAERKERAAKRNEINRDLVSLRQSRKGSINRPGIILALPALFSAAVACRSPIFAETGFGGPAPDRPPVGMRDRRWCPIKKNFAGANLTVRDDFDILSTMDVDEVAIAGYPAASGFIWEKRWAIEWPALPPFAPSTAKGIAARNATAAMLLEWPGMEAWAGEALNASIEAKASGDGRLAAPGRCENSDRSGSASGGDLGRPVPRQKLVDAFGGMVG